MSDAVTPSRDRDREGNGTWTIGTVREHVLDIMDERDRRYTQRHESSQKAIELAMESMNKRLDGMNEFRGTLKDQQSMFLTRSDALALCLIVCTVFGLLLEILNFAFFTHK